MENTHSVFYDSRKIQFLGKRQRPVGLQKAGREWNADDEKKTSREKTSDGTQQSYERRKTEGGRKLIGGQFIAGKEGFGWDDFLSFIDSGQGSLSVQGDDPARLFRRFATNFHHIDAAGGLVEDPTGYWLFIYRRDRWDLPKGMLEEGESAEAAALREVEEECGIVRLEIIHPLPHTYHVYPLEGNRWALKRTQWFYMKTLRCCQAEPQTSEGISMAAWKSPTHLQEVMDNTYGNIRELIRYCLQLRKQST